MKLYILFLGIFAAGCAANSTAPTASVSHHFPLPPYSWMTVSFQNVPEQWTTEDVGVADSAQGCPGFDRKSSGASLLSYSISANLSSAWAAPLGDTFKFGALKFVVDSMNGILPLFQLSDFQTGEGFDNYQLNHYNIICQDVQYEIDSLNQIVVTLKDQNLQIGLKALGISSFSQTPGHFGCQEYWSRGDTYSGTLNDSSSFTIIIKP